MDKEPLDGIEELVEHRYVHFNHKGIEYLYDTLTTFIEYRDDEDNTWKVVSDIRDFTMAKEHCRTNMKTIDIHINFIHPGHVIVCRDGIVRTVTPKDIKEDSFMGKSIFGDCYNLGRIKVQKIIQL